MRIVSLLPSATEHAALLLGHSGVDLAPGSPHLVGRSHECDFPADVAALPVLTAQLTSGSSAADIDAQVRAALAAGQPLYRLDEDRLAALNPDLILTQDLCHVCSIDLPAVRALAARLPSRPAILSLNPQTVEDVLEDLLRVGRAIGMHDRAAAHVARLRERLFAAQEWSAPFAEAPVVAFLEWTDPLFVGGHWIPQLIERAGGAHPLNPTVPKEGSGAAVGPQQAYRVAGKSVRVPPEILAATNPDRLVICPCGVKLADVPPLVDDLAGREWFRALPAVRAALAGDASRVALVDGNQMFSRPGPRLVDAAEFLAGWLNDRPDVIPAEFPWTPWTG